MPDKEELKQVEEAAVDRSDLEDKRVAIELDPDCIHAENVGEFYPETVSAATDALTHMLTPGTRDHRDAGILAACVVSTALHTLIATQQEVNPDA